MTVHIGALGAERGPVDLDFEWFGSTIRVGPDAGDLALLEFLAKARLLDEGDEVGGMELTIEFLRAQIHPDDWDEFYGLARKHRQQMIDMLKVAHTIVRLVTLFPTGRPSDSSSGQRPTDQNSTAASSSAAVSPVDARAMTILKGRPDLKMAVWNNVMAKAEQAREEMERLARTRARVA